MSTEFINDQWRLPNAWNGSESNVNKQSNYSMDFDGSSQYVDLGDDDIFSFGNSTNDSPFSISAWIYMDSTTNFRILAKYDAPNYEYQFDVGGSSNLRFFIFDGTSYRARIGSTLSINQWYHVVATYNGVGGTNAENGIKIYVDGVEITGTTSSNGSYTAMHNTTAPVYIGRIASSYANGKIDGVSIFNYELSSSQVTTLYGSSSTGIGNPMTLNPVAYYPLGDQDAFNGSNYLVPNSSLKDYVFDFVPNDYIDCDNPASLQITGALTFSAWIKTTDTSGFAVFVGKDNVSSGTRSFMLYKSTNVAAFVIFQSNVASSVIGTTVINDGNWHHIIGVNDGTDLKIYIDGTLDNTNVGGGGAIDNGTSDFFIGRRGGTLAQRGFFTGSISQVAVWNSDQSSEKDNIYNNGSPANSYTNTPTSWWKLDASDTYDSSTGNWTIEDHAGSNDGTSSGMTQSALQQSDLSFKTSISPFALSFDSASSDAITLGNTIGNGFTQITCSIWANISTSGLTQSTYRNFLVKFPSGSGDATPFELRSNNGNRTDSYNNKLFFRINTNTGSYGFTDAGFEFTEANKWHHLVGTYDGSNVKLFVDGVEYYSISASGTLNSNNNNATIGKSGSTGNFNGKLSNASIWNTALTSAQVSELYNEGVPSNLNNHSAYSNLVSWWQLGSNSSFNTNWTVLDEKGSNNGTSVNMTEDAIVNGVGSYANGLSSGMGGDEVIGDAPYSSSNSLSVNMDVLDRVEDTPS